MDTPVRAALVATLLFAAAPTDAVTKDSHRSGDAAREAVITMSNAIPFAPDAAGDVGLIAPPGGMAKRIEDRCDLQHIVAEAIAKQARRQGMELVLSEHPEAAAGRVLTVVIEGVLGASGGAWTGTKSLTLRGELREGDTVIGSFVAREQKTALVKNTCDALADCGTRIAGHIAKWLKRPVMKARLGSA